MGVSNAVFVYTFFMEVLCCRIHHSCIFKRTPILDRGLREDRDLHLHTIHMVSQYYRCFCGVVLHIKKYLTNTPKNKS
jgi:hypothetical protein